MVLKNLTITAVKYTILLHFCKPQGDFFLRFHTLRTQFRAKLQENVDTMNQTAQSLGDNMNDLKSEISVFKTE